MFSYLCIFGLIASAFAGAVLYKDCGHHEVTKLDVSQCSGNYCVIHKGKELTLNGAFTANQNTNTLELDISAKVNDIEIEVPGLDTNGCNYVKCPLVKGKSYSIKYSVFVPKLVPNIKAEVTAKLVGQNGTLFCVGVNGEIAD